MIEELTLPENPTNVTQDEFEKARSDSIPELNDGFLINISEHTKLILQNLDGNRSVTRTNKDNIKKSLDEIKRSTQQLYDQVKTILRHSISSAENKTVSLIRNTIREEFSKLAVLPQKITTQPLQDLVKPSIIPSSLPSYAKVVKSTKSAEKQPIPVTKPAIIVSSKQQVSSSKETVNAWRNSIHFKKYTFNPSEVKLVSNHKIRVEFDNQEQRDEILNAINHPDSLVNADIAKKLKPLVILKGIYRDTPVSELKEIIVNQNPNIKSLIKSPDGITYRFTRKNKNENLYNAVFMVTPTIWRSIVELQRINVDHQRVHTEDYPAYLQCYKCMQFGHTKKHCTENTTICSHCSSSEHSYKDCPVKKDSTKVDCYNCSSHCNVPTYETVTHKTHRESIIDLTMTSDSLSNKISNWKVVLDAVPSSNHNAITFDLSLSNNLLSKPKKLSTFKYNTQNIKWDEITEQFKCELAKYLDLNINVDNLSTSQLDKYITKLVTAVQKVSDKIFPRKSSKVTNRAPWWNDKLENLKQKVIKNHHKIQQMKRSKKPLTELLLEKENLRNEYAQAIRIASTEHLREFCNKQGKEDVWSITNRLLKTTPLKQPPSTLKTRAGKYTKTTYETAETFLNEYFPDDGPDTCLRHMQLRNSSNETPDTPADAPFTVVETLRLKRVSEHEASGDGADFSGAFEDGPRNPLSIQSPQLETLSTAISPIPTRTITPQAYSRTHSIPTGDPTTGSFFASIVLFTAIQPSKNTSRNKVIMSDVETASSIKSSQNLSVAPPRPPRSLREKVLTKSSLSKATPREKLSQPSSHPATGKRPADSAPTDASTTRKNASSHTPTLGTKMSQTSVKSDSSIRSSVCNPVDAAIDKVANWKQEEIPPLPVLSDEELSITSAPESPLSEAPEKGKPSLLFNSNRRLGVEMDMATKEANEMLLRGKEALEMAGNMKRECKLTALESLQSLYEMVLALSDSRSRHKHNLERERSRNAQELMRVERAHNKIITQLMKEMASELGHARTDIKNTLQESKAIRGWLNFETQEPFRKTSDLLKAVTDLDKRIGVIQSNLSQQKQEGADNILSHLRVDLTGVKSSVETLKLQLDEMRRVIEKSENNTKKVLETGQKTPATPGVTTIPPLRGNK
ncbi:unnamed protein product [Parnassius apollo]|uniref:(apollo) hypothetical protein n=1 Tax=Parnassius apollo TaxID=110799 RepID=A0A8S3X3W4_PARAO|nr:unnamed protein product [Parnassius apollo]